MNDKIKNIVVTVTFFVIIFGIFIVNIVKEPEEISKSERRKLAQFPKISVENIMNAKSVLLVASGSNKAQAIKNLMEGPITEDFPASALNNHKGKVIVVADEEACALLSK